MPIDRIEIENFKSIRKQSVKITPINVLIGPNGAGKSNFIALSKRLIHLIPGYQKTLHWALIAEEIGIRTILKKCPRFRNWVENFIYAVKA